MKEPDIYSLIAKRFGYSDSKEFIDYLKVLFTEEEGRLLCEFFEPSSCEEVAKRIGVEEEGLYERLENLRKRRLLFKGKNKYLFHIGIHGFFARIAAAEERFIPEGFYEAWAKFMPQIERRMININLEIDQKTFPLRERIVPARLALERNPKNLEKIFWYEDIHEMLRRKAEEGVVAVFDCPCRRMRKKCERPTLNCFEFGDYAEFNLKQGSRLRAVSAEEAIVISDEAEMAGLLHSGVPNWATGLGRVLCHCCSCCCNVMGAFIRFGTAYSHFSPSRFQAIVDEDLCNGCQTCIERCPFDAIEMKKTKGSPSKRFKAFVLPEKCMGCGLCVLGCKKKALGFEIVRPPEHIPAEPPSSFPPIVLPGMDDKYFSFLRGEL